MPDVLCLDLRDINATSWAELWGSVLDDDVASRIDTALKAQVIDPNAPLLPDLCATAPIIAQAIRSRMLKKVELFVPETLGSEACLTLNTVMHELGVPALIICGGTPLTGSALPPLAAPRNVLRPPSALLAEGRASEVISSGDLTVEERAKALLLLRRPQEAAALPDLCDSDIGLRLAVLATRGAGLMNRLPDLRRRVLQRRPDTRLKQAWHLFDLAVASSDDPVRLGYLKSLTAARALAWGKSAQLDAGIALWGATYHFHAGHPRAALAGHHVGLQRLERLGALQRAVHVRIRLAHLNAVCGRTSAAQSVAAAGFRAAVALGHLSDADELAFSSGTWRVIAGGPLDAPEFRSERAAEFAALWRIMTDGLHEDTLMPAVSNRLWAEALLARSARTRLTKSERYRLAQAQASMGLVDKEMHMHRAARLLRQSRVQANDDLPSAQAYP